MAKVRNWARNQECDPREVLRPRSTDQVAAIVARAASDGSTVKTIGAGHSFTSAAMTDVAQYVCLDSEVVGHHVEALRLGR